MHIPTHILSGWVIGNAFPLRSRERLNCMIAASIADLDGLGILFGRDTYDRWHHVVGHGLPFCLAVSTTLALLANNRSWPWRGLLLLIYGCCFHVHLLMDYYGSGPGWPIVYFWPFSSFKFVNWQAWALSSWQNQLAAGVLLIATIVIARLAGRTPLEVLMPSLDARFVHAVGGRSKSTP